MICACLMSLINALMNVCHSFLFGQVATEWLKGRKVDDCLSIKVCIFYNSVLSRLD